MRTRFLAPIAATVLLVVAACSSGGGNNATPTTTSPTAAQSPATTADSDPSPSDTTAASPTSGPVTPLDIVIGTSLNTHVVAMEMAIIDGAFASAGLNVTRQTQQSTAAQVPLLSDNTWQLTTGGAATVISAVAGGVDLKIIAAVSYNAVRDNGSSRGTLVRADSGMTSFADLKGTLGTSSVGNSLDLHLRAAVDLSGGDSSQLTSVEVPNANALQALRDGQIDVLAVPQPFATQGQNDPTLLNLGDAGIITLESDTAPVLYIIALGSWADEHAAELTEFLRILEEQSEVANGDTNRVLEIASSLTEQPVERLANVPLPVYGTVVDRDVLQREIDVMVEYGGMSASEAPTVDDIWWQP
jgi:ABC-type nitrate/sulfonate/bicarbonate transport system substrate-binding protein